LIYLQVAMHVLCMQVYPMLDVVLGSGSVQYRTRSIERLESMLFHGTRTIVTLNFITQSAPKPLYSPPGKKGERIAAKGHCTNKISEAAPLLPRNYVDSAMRRERRERKRSGTVFICSRTTFRANRRPPDVFSTSRITLPFL